MSWRHKTLDVRYQIRMPLVHLWYYKTMLFKFYNYRSYHLSANGSLYYTTFYKIKWWIHSIYFSRHKITSHYLNKIIIIILLPDMEYLQNMIPNMINVSRSENMPNILLIVMLHYYVFFSQDVFCFCHLRNVFSHSYTSFFLHTLYL